jgi:hypothetical protein
MVARKIGTSASKTVLEGYTEMCGREVIEGSNLSTMCMAIKTG